MLQIKEIRKQYKTGDFIQKALDGISLNLRDSEFVAVLGPSGSGKTTLLNIIGGLDRYDSGDLIINGVSTKDYTDRDWDSYRNHTIGFVFQSYNLIPHQSVLSNVELALTISGASEEERKRKAEEVLRQVGLEEHMNKKPNQLSGGQMQRVAIARALVNNPDILLADEPTGALDSDTSVQVMDLLHEVAKDRLVVMVTHNPELAEKYATRIVKLKDGRITDDSNPFTVEDTGDTEHRNLGRASMSFRTALALSFNNLLTKKARTLLVSFAGSIGIIGIALILALSNGVNGYIDSIEEETLSEYPVQIEKTSFDFTSFMGTRTKEAEDLKNYSKTETDSTKVTEIQTITAMINTLDSNDLKSFKKHLEKEETDRKLKKYASAIEYNFDVLPQIYLINNGSFRKVNPDQTFQSLGLGSEMSSSTIMSMSMTTDTFYALPDSSSMYKGQYELRAGRWPEKYNEVIVILSPNGKITDMTLYTLGLKDTRDLEKAVKKFAAGKKASLDEEAGTFSTKKILGTKFRLINQSDFYVYNSAKGVWTDKSANRAHIKSLLKNRSEEIIVVGIIQPKKDASVTPLLPGIGYKKSLKSHIIKVSAKSKATRAQLNTPKKNIFTGKPFDEKADMDDMFSTDPNAFKDIFSFDPSKIKLDPSALTDMDLSDMDFAKIIKDAGGNVTEKKVRALFQSLMTGYDKYSKNNSKTSIQALQKGISQYMASKEVQQIIVSELAPQIQQMMSQIFTQENVANIVKTVMSGFGQYVNDHGYTDMSKLNEYLEEYLASPEAQALMEKAISDIMGSADIDFSLTEQQLNSLASKIIAGYPAYAKNNNLADFNSVEEGFMKYLQTKDGQKRLEKGINSMVDMDALGKSASKELQKSMASAMTAFSAQLASSLQNAMNFDVDKLASLFNMDMSEEEMQEMMATMMSKKTSNYEGNLKTLGYADMSDPYEIVIYPKDFDSKEKVVEIIEDYNKEVKENGQKDRVIAYTDVVGTLMSSVTDIIDAIGYVLIAFVSISLVVSSIMIGVITYISVLERNKEIGILRAIGASKRNISNVFNAETFMIGALAGIMGVLISNLLLIPGNMIIKAVTNGAKIHASIPIPAMAILILLSIILTLIGGLIPSRKAAKSDPVTALRTE